MVVFGLIQCPFELLLGAASLAVNELVSQPLVPVGVLSPLPLQPVVSLQAVLALSYDDENLLPLLHTAVGAWRIVVDLSIPGTLLAMTRSHESHVLTL